MITGPLFKWFGSKWSASKYYPHPLHTEIIEPFAGSAGYSLRHYRRNVTLAESNIQLFKLWSWLIHHATSEEIRDIPINIPEGTNIQKMGLNWGQALLLKHWQRTNNVGDCWTISPWGNKPGQWTENTRTRISSEFHEIKHWRVYNDAWTLIADFDYSESLRGGTWFIDPPYQFNYQYKSSPVDYNLLRRNIDRITGQVIVCEAICPKTGQMPTWLPFTAFRDTVTSRRKITENHHSKELIYERR